MIIFGKQLFLHLLEHHKKSIIKIYLAKECEKPLFSKIARLNVPIERVDNKKAQAMAKGGNHQGFFAEVDEFSYATLESLKKENFLVVLYGLSDVGNIGAIIRTAYALGVGGIIVVGKSLQIEGVVRSSSGAAYEIMVSLQDDGLSVLNELKQSGFKIYASASSGKDARDVKFGEKNVLIMGSEDKGIPKRAVEKSNECIGIKMKNSWDSINVSAAFAILCDRMING